MVKFGQQLESLIYDDWREGYLEYESLKTLIEEMLPMPEKEKKDKKAKKEKKEKHLKTRLRLSSVSLEPESTEEPGTLPPQNFVICEDGGYLWCSCILSKEGRKGDVGSI